MAFADCKFPDQNEIVVGRILDEDDEHYTMNLLYYSDKQGCYIFNEDKTRVQKDYILFTFDDPTESDIGLKSLGDDSYELIDPDYIPSEESEDDDDSEDESLVDEDEEEED